MSLINEIEDKKKEIFADGYPMSIGEIISMYKEGAIDVHPEFQRIFRWKEVQKSKLIESILLGIPIPSIFVSQRKDGVWDVVDGQQRISTILEFVGELKNESKEIMPPSKLVKTEYLPSLDGIMWNNPEDQEKEFSQDLKFVFKREKLDIKIVKRESDENIKYELFQRLNTLGSKLSDQEVRNCILVMMKPEFYRWLKSLSEYEPFLNVISIADRLIDEQYHVELVLRFLILKNHRTEPIRDLGEFLTERMISMAKDPNTNLESEEKIFKKTFDILDQTLGSDTFKRYNSAKHRFEGSFLISAFEAVGIGIGKNHDRWSQIEIDATVQDGLKKKVQDLWSNREFQDNSGTGVNVSRRFVVIIPIGERTFVP